MPNTPVPAAAGGLPVENRHLNGVRPPKSRRKLLRITRQRRERMEAIVEGLLALLDEVEGDVDEEDDGDAEPEESGYGDADGMSVEQDGEPSLGWTDWEARYGRYADRWPYGDDGEEEHDGREPDPDDEDNGDSEPDDNGIGDQDGAEEQYGGRDLVRYDGSGHDLAKKQLSGLHKRRKDLPFRGNRELAYVGEVKRINVPWRNGFAPSAQIPL